MHQRVAPYLLSILVGLSVVAAGCADDETSMSAAGGELVTQGATVVTGPSKVTLCNLPLYTKQTTQRLCGYVTPGTDGSAVVSAWFTVDDGPAIAVVPGSGGFVDTSTSLAEGSHTIRLYARSAAGNITFEEKPVTVDITPPSLQVLSPTPSDVLTSTLVNVTSSVADATPVRVQTQSVQSSNVDSGVGTVTHTVDLVNRGYNTLVVRATDAAGNTSEVRVTVYFCPSSDVACFASAQWAPLIVSSSQSTTTVPASGGVTFQVVGSDPQNSPLTFSWTASDGALGVPTSDSTTSEVVWTPPTCAVASIPLSITATVTNALNLSATQHFTVAGLPTCPAGWAPAASLATPRYNHTATLLLDGKVLVSGGVSSSDTLAEVYDPVSDTWSVTGAMTSSRDNHTATLLPDGKVLVTGGTRGANVLATAEVYDPASGTWSATGSMASSRYHHTATLLPDGKVLVSGGYSGYAFLATSEVYDPASGTWSATGSMASSRYHHTATLLPDGKVLVSGGTGSDGRLATAEVYEPASGTWSATGSMASPRYRHTATLLSDGRVLVSGGSGSVGRLAQAEVYEPASGTWSAAGSLAWPRIFHSATLLPNGTVLVTGGDSGQGFYAETEVYDPATNTWSATVSLATSRGYHTATLLPNSKLLVVGGYTVNEPLATAELFTPWVP